MNPAEIKTSNPDVKILSPSVDFSFNNGWYELAQESHFWMQWRFNVFLKQMHRLGLLPDAPLRGIEIGCGQGVLRHQVEGYTKWIIDGVDLELEALKGGRVGRGELYFYNIFDKKEEFKNRYDFLFLYDVLEHIEKPQDFLQACQFHVKPQGYIFVNVPACKLFYSRYDEVVGHLRRYTVDSLKKELVAADLEVLDIAFWGFMLTPLLLIRKLTTLARKDVKDIVRTGFKPPANFVNSLFLRLMKIETQLVKRPLIGTSVMAVVRKR